MKRYMLAALLLCLSVEVFSLQVSLRPSAEIQGSRVYVRDIAALTGDAAAIAQLGACMVFEFAEGQSHAVLDLHTVRQSLIRHADLSFILIGTSVRVSRKLSTWDEAAVSTIIERWMQQQKAPGVWKLHTLVLPRMVSSMHPHLEVVQGRLSPGTQTFVLGFRSSAGVLDGSFQAEVRLELFESLLTAARDLSRGTLIEASTLTEELRPAVSLAQHPLTLEEIRGLRLRSGVRRGELINRTMIEWPLLVRRRDTVSVRFEENGIIIELEAEAMEDGRAYEQIRVRNPLSGRVFHATVMPGGRIYAGARPEGGVR